MTVASKVSARKRIVSLTAIAFAVALIVPVMTWAHAVVYPRNSTAGARERYTIRVPNERGVATTRVQITFPASLRVSGFMDTPGWKLEILRDTAKRITGAVWTGNLPVEHFAEFTFNATNPKDATELVWPVLQTYADGELASWTGPRGTDRPASATVLAPPPDTTAVAEANTGRGGASPMISYVALGVSLLSLGLALRKKPA
ncbi:MAG TPA: DUF1775 domain-containing protein [Gemmatimonadaceae bacterium]|nr:DUF1775 domain-containing protein [Gemmatimonadaceae bacterium]